ncbi:MAG: twin-arginine translocase subunit TatC [Candidatus Hydrogenedentota bacterium]
MSEHDENNSDEARMTFTEHLGELRSRIIRAGLAVFAAIVIAYIAGGYLVDAIMWPIVGEMTVKAPASDAKGEQEQNGEEESGKTEEAAESPEGPTIRLMYTNPLNPVLVRLKVAAYGGLLLAFPYVIFQICAFIFPGLRPNEKRAVRIMLTGGSVLAIAGVCVAYFGVLPVVVPYLMHAFLPAGYELSLRPDETIPIIIKAIVGFAIAFQFPMVVLVLVYMNLLSPETLKKYRKLALVIMAVGAAMLTPPDPFSMMVMLLPLALLYEGSIWLSYLVVRRREKEANATP